METVAARPQSVAETVTRRWRSWRWPVLTLVVLAVIAAIGAYLTAPRPGGQMDAESTNPDGAHALVALLRDNGVEVIVAKTAADVEHAGRPDTLIVMAQTQYLLNDAVLDRLTKVPGDLLPEPVTEERAEAGPLARGPAHRPDRCRTSGRLWR